MIKVNRKTAIGKGNFGAVYTGQLLQENSIKTVAIKVIKSMHALLFTQFRIKAVFTITWLHKIT